MNPSIRRVFSTPNTNFTRRQNMSRNGGDNECSRRSSSSSKDATHTNGDECVKETCNCELVVNSKSLGSGILTISTERVRWTSTEKEDFAPFEIEYPELSLHAICKDAAFPKPCIYCQINRTGDDGDGDEVRFAPEDEDDVDALFAALSECSALHPDEDADGGVSQRSSDDTVMSHLDSVFHAPGAIDKRFEDPEEE